MKKIAALLLALMICTGVSSCGNDAEKSAPLQTEEITTTTTTTAATTTAKTKESAEKADGTTAKAKKKKKKKTETTKAKNTEAKPAEKKKTTAKKTTAATEAPKEEPSAQSANFDNGVFSLSIPDSEWVSFTEYKSLIGKLAKANDQFGGMDFSSMIGSLYFYNGDIDKSYPTCFTIMNPISEGGFESFKIDDIADLMVQSVQQQWAEQEGIEYSSNDFVTHGGVKMLRIRATAATYVCDEYVFLSNGKMCIIAVYYGSDSSGISRFEGMLDTIGLK